MLHQFLDKFRGHIEPGAENAAINLGHAAIEFRFRETQMLDLIQGRTQRAQIIHDSLRIIISVLMLLKPNEIVRGPNALVIALFDSVDVIGAVIITVLQGVGDIPQLALVSTNQANVSGIADDFAHGPILDAGIGDLILRFTRLDSGGNGHKDGRQKLAGQTLIRRQGPGVDAEGLQLLPHGRRQISLRGSGIGVGARYIRRESLLKGVARSRASRHEAAQSGIRCRNGPKGRLPNE